MTCMSKKGFFSKNVTSAAFILVGTIPVDMNKLIMFVMVDNRQLSVLFEARSAWDRVSKTLSELC